VADFELLSYALCRYLARRYCSSSPAAAARG